tara:strand:+ start:82 stop:864 length:783 start_codon:yes stop_codon:yes gene_type:complete
MEDNSLLMIVLAFLVGYMCSGMMENMCGVNTRTNMNYNTCNKLIEGSSNKGLGFGNYPNLAAAVDEEIDDELQNSCSNLNKMIDQDKIIIPLNSLSLNTMLEQDESNNSAIVTINGSNYEYFGNASSVDDYISYDYSDVSYIDTANRVIYGKHEVVDTIKGEPYYFPKFDFEKNIITYVVPLPSADDPIWEVIMDDPDNDYSNDMIYINKTFNDKVFVEFYYIMHEFYCFGDKVLVKTYAPEGAGNPYIIMYTNMFDLQQ